MNEAEIIKDFKEKFDNLVKSHKGKIVITSHINPDDDSIASSLSTYYYLKNILKIDSEVEIYYSNNPVDRWSKIKYFEKIKFVTDVAEVIEKSDLLILLDCQGYYRASNLPETIIEKNIVTVVIDHHKTNPDREYTLMLTYPAIFKSSNAEIMYSIFYETLVNLDKDIAEILLLGIYGDTGSLRYINTENAGVLNVVQEIIKKSNVNVDSFLGKLEKYKLAQLKILAEFLKNTEILEVENWGKFSLSFVTREEMKDYTKEQVSSGKAIYGFYQKAVDGTKWGVLIYPNQTNENEWSLSFRSQPGQPNVRIICQALDPNGGGHDAAAGCKISENIQNTKLNIPAIKKILLDYLNSNKPILIPE